MKFQQAHAGDGGVLPGRLSPTVTRIIHIAFYTCLSAFVVFAIPVLVFGSWGKRVVGVLPLLVVLKVLMK